MKVKKINSSLIVPFLFSLSQFVHSGIELEPRKHKTLQSKPQELQANSTPKKALEETKYFRVEINKEEQLNVAPLYLLKLDCYCG